MVEYDVVKDTVVDAEEEYPQHVKDKIQAYKNAKLKYKIQEDGAMIRSIAFNRIKKLKPEKYYRNITQIMRLRSPDKKKEVLVYRTQEGAFDGGDREHNDSVQYGISELIHTQPVYDTKSGDLVDRTIDIHTNVFTIPYSSKGVDEILKSRIPRKYKNEYGNEELEEFQTPHMMIGILSNKYPQLWESNEVFGIKNLDAFTNDDFDDLLLMGYTGENTLGAALDRADEMIRTAASSSPNMAKIKQQITNISSAKSESTTKQK